jgi:hypothetical protein
MRSSTLGKSASQRGAALILVLSLMALMAVVSIAFLTSATKQVSVSNQSATLIQSSEAAQLALSLVVQDLRQEIQAGSILPDPARVSPALEANLLYPATPQSAVPDRTSAAAEGVDEDPTPPNLVKQSLAGREFYDKTRMFGSTPVYPRAAKYPVAIRASEISTADSITPAKWNRPLLLPRKDTQSLTDLTPRESGEVTLAGRETLWKWKAPNWIFLQKGGETDSDVGAAIGKAQANGTNPVVARFAYQIYDQGGLLDMNVAGYDPTLDMGGVSAGIAAARRGSIGFADLRIPEIGFSDKVLRELVAIRNPGTLRQEDVAPYKNRYANFLLNGRNNLGFMRVAGFSESGENVSNRAIPSRLALINFLQKLTTDETEKIRLLDSLQYLTHFSRSLEQPSFRPGYWKPKGTAADEAEAAKFTFPRIVPPAPAPNGIPSDDVLYSMTGAPANIPSNPSNPNPSLPGMLNASDTRWTLNLPWEMAISNNRGGNDAWGTLKQRDPSSSDTRTLQELINPGFLEIRVDRKLNSNVKRMDGSPFVGGEPLVKKRFPLERLAWLTHKGPSALLGAADPLYNAGGTVANIYASFGLKWVQDITARSTAGSYYWTYDHGKSGGIFRLEDLAKYDLGNGTPREPDFFETLKASIGAGSLGKSAMAEHNPGEPWDPATYQHMRDRKLDFQVFDIGVNIVDQYDADSFPTIVKIPNPNARTPETPYAPPLHVARGVENLPYFYRFHWQGVEDFNPLYAAIPPTTPGALPNPGYPIEITDNLGVYNDLGGFKGGSVAVLGFPELWNPHAASAVQNEGPTEFRIVAVSEVPEALGDSFLYNLPREGSPYTDAFFTAGRLEFGVRPSASFAYTPQIASNPKYPNSNYMLSLWGNLINLTNYGAYGGGYFGSGAAYSNVNYSFYWPHEADSLSVNVTAVPNYWRFGSGPYWYNAITTLFWNDIPVGYPEVNGSLFMSGPGNSSPGFGLALYPMSKRPTEGFALRVKPTDTPLTLPLPGDNDEYGGIRPRLAPGGWPPASERWPYPNTPAYPYYPEPDVMFPALNFSNEQLTSTSPTIKPWQQHIFTLTDARVSAQAQNLTFTSPGSTTPPGGVGFSNGMNGGTEQSNRRLDQRGTELLFSVPNNNLFREPTTLCQPGLPSGSNLTAGPGNYLSKIGGSITDDSNQKWVGFSLGEVPAQTIVLSKVYMKAKTTRLRDRDDSSRGVIAEQDANRVAVDIVTDNQGKGIRTGTATIPGWDGLESDGLTTAAIPRTPATKGYRVRYFLVPNNIAGLRNTQFTIRLQCKDRSGNWITYDERLMRVQEGNGGRWSSAPILGRKQVIFKTAAGSGRTAPDGSGTFGDGPPDFTGKAMNWSTPMILSYDPRTPRFGHPMRMAYNTEGTNNGTLANLRQLMIPTLTDPLGFSTTSPGITDRPGPVHFDEPKPGVAQTVTAQGWVPALWAKWFRDANGGQTVTDIVKTYKDTIGTSGSGLGETKQWWAGPGNNLFQQPTLNANDYGWFPRLTGSADAPAPSMVTPPINIFTTNQSRLLTSGPDLPNFYQNPTSLTAADINQIKPDINFRPEGTWDSVSRGPAPLADTLRIGSFSQNVAPSRLNPYAQAYADPDDVVRRAGGAFATDAAGVTSSIEGLPMGQRSGSMTPTAAANRPVILNRPFRSVAEMGYAFRGSPWKNISFFAPETADAALLDVFCLAEPPPLAGGDGVAADPVVAGKINLNTRQEPVLRALLAGALKDELNTAGLISTEDAAAAAKALIARTTGTKEWLGPLTNVSELAGKLIGKDMGTTVQPTDPVYSSWTPPPTTNTVRNLDMELKTGLTWHYSGFSADLDNVFSSTKDKKNQRLRESVIRALADGGQTRVWNLLIDLIVQTGRIPDSARDLTRFAKDGEARVWVHLAIDRFTGEILDKQLEWVPE